MDRRKLKILACSSMLADHICRAFFRGDLAAEIIRQSFGRLAFPLFAYMLIRGFYYTRSRTNYCIALLITAVISEPLFDMAFHHTAIYIKDQNTIFTLLLALLALIVIDRFKDRLVLQLLIAAVFACAAQFAHLDYGAAGIAVCVIYYYTAEFTPYRSCIFACMPLLLVYGSIGALISVFVLYFYTDIKQKLSRVEKIGFYLFYPAHLAILWGVFLLFVK